MGTRTAAAAVAAFALVATAGSSSVLAGAAPVPVDVSPAAAGEVTVDAGLLHWSVDALTAPGPGWIRRNRPCATFASVIGGPAGRICLVSPRRADAARPDGSAFRTPVRTRWTQGMLTVAIRQADAGLPPGPYVAVTRCRMGACADTSTQVTLPVPRVVSCEGRRPWLVHEGASGVGRAVAVTFDDGPGANTARVARILQRESVLATFFQLGRMVEGRPDLTARLVRSGHVVGNHSYSHPLLSGVERSELVRTNRVIHAAGAPLPCVFRAPYGENPPPVVALAKQLGMTTVHWNTDPGDWRGLSADAIADTTLRQVRPGSILVFHDADPGSAMVPALRVILERLKSRGYRFLTVPELLRLDIKYR